VIKGRGIFQKRQVVDGSLEISAGGATDDERLRDWVHESRVVLPILDAMVRNGYHDHGQLRSALDDLRRRVEALEREVARWRTARSDA
jgi:hypothetical protein